MKPLSKEEIDKLVQWARKVADALCKAWEAIKKAVLKAWEAFKKYVLVNMKYPPVGFKRLAKAAQLNYYESISAGKSNNWRKMHGLHLARRGI